MSAVKQKPEPRSETSASHRVLDHLFSEYRRAREDMRAAEARLAGHSETIELLVSSLPREDQEVFQRRFDELRSGAEVNRGGEVFGNVITLFRRRPQREWTISEIQTALEENGSSPDSKALHNAIGYLAKSGRLRRVSRGRYVVVGLGAGIEMEDIDDGTARVTEHDA